MGAGKDKSQLLSEAISMLVCKLVGHKHTSFVGQQHTCCRPSHKPHLTSKQHQIGSGLLLMLISAASMVKQAVYTLGPWSLVVVLVASMGRKFTCKSNLSKVLPAQTLGVSDIRCSKCQWYCTKSA